MVRRQVEISNSENSLWNGTPEIVGGFLAENIK
jgi:hypothetical protein